MTAGPEDSTSHRSTVPEPAAPDDPLLGVTYGDVAAADLLRRNLGSLAEQHDGTPLGGLLDDVLSGRRPVADLHADPDFAEVTRQGLGAYREHLASLTPEERAALEREAATLDEP